MGKFLDETGLAELWSLSKAAFGNQANHYVWEKAETAYAAVEYASGSDTEPCSFAYPKTTSQAAEISGTFYPSYEISEDGTFSLTGTPITIVRTYYNSTLVTVDESIVGYYTYPAYSDVGQQTTGLSRIFRVEASSKYGQAGSSTYGYVWTVTGCTILTAELRNTVIGYVNSPDPNAYPPAVADGYTYTAMGQLGEKVRIATGSYTGTGTYGSSNPCSLTFDFAPKLVLVSFDGKLNYNSNGADHFVWISGHTSTYTNNYSGSQSQVTFSVSGNTLSWYASGGGSLAYVQCNNSGYKYHYVAIG